MFKDFKPIFDYLDEMKVELTKDITEAVTTSLKVKLDNLQTSVDSFAKDVKKFDRERLATNHRIDPSTIRYGARKLKTWAKPVGEKLQMPLVN